MMIARPALWAGALMMLHAGGAHAADVASGQKLARTFCVTCHVVAPGVGPAQMTAGIPTFMAVASKPDQSAAKIKGFLLNPHPPMPQMQLTVFELDNLAAYILSLTEKP
jgi:mono/diheme cytochrome c family protein